LHHRSIVFLVSDFQGEDLERPLKLLAQRHDVVAAALEDPTERELPDIGLARFVDPETGDTIDIDTSNPEVRRRYAEATEAEQAVRRNIVRRLAIDEVVIGTDTGYLEPLMRFFRTRERRVHRR
jgi:uncharacterized protein (DUF58 family)